MNTVMDDNKVSLHYVILIHTQHIAYALNILLHFILILYSSYTHILILFSYTHLTIHIHIYIHPLGAHPGVKRAHTSQRVYAHGVRDQLA